MAPLRILEVALQLISFICMIALQPLNISIGGFGVESANDIDGGSLLACWNFLKQHGLGSRRVVTYLFWIKINGRAKNLSLFVDGSTYDAILVGCQKNRMIAETTGRMN